MPKDTATENALVGGDDYEIAFTFNSEYLDKVDKIGREANIPITVIGTVEKGHGVSVLSESGGVFNHYALQGFDHFKSRA